MNVRTLRLEARGPTWEAAFRALLEAVSALPSRLDAKSGTITVVYTWANDEDTRYVATWERGGE